MLNARDIYETLDMINRQHLDIRTITMGISLRDCADRNTENCGKRIYEKSSARRKIWCAPEKRSKASLGIPIVNKRISVTPIAVVGESCEGENFVPLAVAMDNAAKECGVNFIGGFSALVHKGMTVGDRKLIESIPGSAQQY